MATLRIVNEKSDTTVTIDGYVAKEKELLKSLEGYCFYTDDVSNSSKAEESDFFNEDAQIIAVQQVNGGNTLKGIVGGFTLFGVFGSILGGLYGLKKDLKKPGIGSTTTSSNNSLGDRGNEVRLGERIEDIWGTHPKVFPSLLSSYTRFDSEYREVECSTLSLGRGDYGTERWQDNDYNCENIPTMKLAKYDKGVSIAGTPTEVITTLPPSYPPLYVRQVGNIASFELGNASDGRFQWGETQPYSEGESYYLGLKNSPYFLCVSEVEVVANTTYQKTIRLTGASVTNWEDTVFISGGLLAFEGLVYSDDGITFYDSFDYSSASVTNVTTSYMEFTVTYSTTSSRDSFWDKLTVGANKGLLYYPEYVEAERPPITQKYGVWLTSAYLSDKVYIDYQTNGTASYLSNFVCDNGTAGGNNTAVLTITYADNSTSTEDFSCPQYKKDKTMRVGYTHTKTFLQSASPKPVYFTWHRSDTSGNNFVLRDVYRFEDLTGFSNDDVTIVRVERRYSDFFGASNEMKLSCKATRTVQTVTENLDGTWQLSGVETSEIGVADRLDIVIANLHLDAYNGRRTTATLDYASLKSSVEAIEEYVDVTCGISFDDDSLKYEDELKALLIPYGIQVYQLGSKLYFLAEEAQTSADMLFTHRDYDVSSFKMSHIFRDNDNYDGVKLSYKTAEEISGYYGDDYEIGDTVELFMPQDTTLSNPLEIQLDAVHTEQQANLTLYREYYKQKYAKKTIQFTAFSMGRQVIPGMVIAVADNLKRGKSDGEILSTYIEDGYTIAETSQILPTAINFVAITNEDGSVSYYSILRLSDYSFRFNNTPPSVYTDWEQAKTRYMVYQSNYDKYLVTDVDVKGFDEVEITAINYDSRYYQEDSGSLFFKQGNITLAVGPTFGIWTFFTDTPAGQSGAWVAKIYLPDGTVYTGDAFSDEGEERFNYTGFFDYNGNEVLTYELYYNN